MEEDSTLVSAVDVDSTHMLWSFHPPSCFEACLQNCKKRLLSSSCLSVHQSIYLSAWNNLASTGRILMQF